MRPSAKNHPSGQLPRWPEYIGRGVKPRTPEWEEWVRKCDAKKGYPVCGRCNRFDEPCEYPSPAPDPHLSYARRPCHYHGDRSRKGALVGNAKTLEHSRYRVGSSAKSVYDRHAADEEYVSMREDMALLRTMIQECRSEMDAELPEELDPKVFDEREVAERNLLRLDILARQAAALERVPILAQRLVQMQRSELVRIKLAEETVSSEQAQAFSVLVLDAVTDHVGVLCKEFNVPWQDARRTIDRIRTVVYQGASTMRGVAHAEAGESLALFSE